MTRTEIQINRLHTIIQEYKEDIDFIPASQKALKHIIHIADTKEDANEMLLYSIDLLLNVTSNNLEQTKEAIKKIILEYATELRKILQGII